MSDFRRKLNEVLSVDGGAKRIEGAVQAAEATTSGEIRVMIISRCDPEAKGDIRAQAVREFYRHGLDKTRDKTGVLLLIALEDNAFYILGDSGINEKVSQGYWDVHSTILTTDFASGRLIDGICFFVGSIGNKLSEYFPRRDDDTNELPDDVIVGG